MTEQKRGAWRDDSPTAFSRSLSKQARYRQYFEEDPAASMVSGDATGIPMETQYLMQEVLTDGMAFCSLM